MMIDPRDMAVIKLVARFKQTTSAQVYQLLFNDRTRTPCDRTLNRLVRNGYLIRIERRIPGGAHGGSGQYVYALSRSGQKVFQQSPYRHIRVVNYHTLMIVDTYIAIHAKELAGSLTISGLSSEPDCWLEFGNDILKPDLFVELMRPGGEQMLYWFEIDMGTEGQRQIREKLERYIRCWKHPEAAGWSQWPITVFVAVDAERANELRSIVARLPADERHFFRVATLQSLAQANL